MARPAVRVRLKYGGPHTTSTPKWIWTAVRRRRLLSLRKCPPICYWWTIGMPVRKRNDGTCVPWGRFASSLTELAVVSTIFEKILIACAGPTSA